MYYSRAIIQSILCNNYLSLTSKNEFESKIFKVNNENAVREIVEESDDINSFHKLSKYFFLIFYVFCIVIK